MALSPYRFSLGDDDDTTLTRPRTGLASVTAASGATSGGEGYRRSALMPGSRGYMAATFGGAPNPDYVAPTPEDTDPEPAPTPPPAAEPPAPAAAPQMAEVTGQAGEGANEGGATDAGPPGDLGDLIGDIDIGGRTVGGLVGAGLGGLALGPIGGLVGGIAGRAIGSTLDGGQSGGGYSGGDPGNAQQGLDGSGVNTEASQAGNMMGFGTFAQGGRVPHHTKGQMMKQKGGLGGVMAGGQNMGAYAMGGKVKMPGYAMGGRVDQLAGPDPAGADDGFAALEGGEFVVKRDMADRYAPILDDINEGRFPATGDTGGGGNLNLAMGAQGNMPPSAAESMTPDDMMQRLATIPPEQRQTLQGAMSDPMLSGALFSLLGPAFMPVIAMLQQPVAPPQMGGQPPMSMMSMPPDLAGSRPPGGLGAVNA
jgi:hypothetical protein